MDAGKFTEKQKERRVLADSEIKALLALAEVPRRLNEARVADYLLSTLDEKDLEGECWAVLLVVLP